MLAEITRDSRFTAEVFRVLAMERPVDVPELHLRIRKTIEDAERFIRRIPNDEVGYVFLEGDKPVQPESDEFARYVRRPGGMQRCVAGLYRNLKRHAGAIRGAAYVIVPVMMN